MAGSIVIGLVAMIVVTVGLAAPVRASCAEPPPLAEAIGSAEVAFVGTVVGLANQDRWATVSVEEIWRGRDLGPTVEVRAGPAGNAASSIDRTYTAGTRYLFVVNVAEDALQDSSCSSTTPWSDDLAQFRPAAVRRPVTPPVDAAPPEPASFVAPVAAVVVVGLALFGAVAAAALASRRARQ